MVGTKVENAILANAVMKLVFAIKDWDDYQEWVKIVAKHRGAITNAHGCPPEPLRVILEMLGHPNEEG